MKNYHKIKLPQLNGFVYVEKYDYKNKPEWDRSDILDENGNYIDYIGLDGLFEKSYKECIALLKQCKNIDEFLNRMGQFKYDYSDNLKYLMDSIYEDSDDEDYAYMLHQLNTLKEKEFIEKYSINRIGNTYFHIEEW